MSTTLTRLLAALGLLSAIVAVTVIFVLTQRSTGGTPIPAGAVATPVGPVPTAPDLSVTPKRSERGPAPLPGNPPLWAGADPADYPVLPRFREDVTGARLVKIDRSLMSSLEPGRWVDLVIPQLADPITVIVDENSLRASGIRVLKGRVEGRRVLPFVVTLGAGATYATIGTRDGIWNLRGSATLAWIIDGRVLNQHVDPAVPDYVIRRPGEQPADDSD